MVRQSDWLADFAAPDEGSSEQSGTGFIWDAAGHIVTNNHVVEGDRELGRGRAEGREETD
jgi:S1-C subfamily serine protease